MMNYHPYQQSNPLEKRVKQLEADKKELCQAIEDLNSCYSEKIYLLQKAISQQTLKYEQLLEWKQEHMDKSLFEVERYELEIKKMIQILDNAHHNFEKEKQGYFQQIEQQANIIKQLKESNDALSEFNQQNENKIEQMVKIYTQEIDKLKQELRDLREESMFSESSSQVLRQVTNSQNTECFEPQSRVFVEGGDQCMSKISTNTVMAE